MHKSRLQLICQQRKWGLPEYSTTFDGPPHSRRFRATVVVDGVSYESSSESKSSKEAQNAAAGFALQHLDAIQIPTPATTPLSLSPPKEKNLTAESQIRYKSLLQTFAQKKRCELPIYEVSFQGPHHCPRFKATVTVFGQTFESFEFSNTLREAEHSAAKAALMVLTSEGSSTSQGSAEVNVEDDTGIYKSLLLHLTQKEQSPPPKYTTLVGGLSHMPLFSSVVEVRGKSFEGRSAKTKKLAEVYAAKVAWDHFQTMG